MQMWLVINKVFYWHIYTMVSQFVVGIYTIYPFLIYSLSVYLSTSVKLISLPDCFQYQGT